MAGRIIFRRIRGKLIPIKVKGRLKQDELVNIVEVQRARKVFRKRPDLMATLFLGSAQGRSKETGKSIAKRIAKFRKKNK